MRIIKYLPVLILLIVYGCGNGNDKNKIEASGNIEATNVTVSSQVTGKVLSLLKDEGDLVSAGDTVLIIDHEILEYQLDQALAAQEAAQAQLSLLKNGAREEDIKQADEAEKQAQINYDMAKKDKERFDALYDTKSITGKQYEDANSRFNLAQAQLTSAQCEFKETKKFCTPGRY